MKIMQWDVYQWAEAKLYASECFGNPVSAGHAGLLQVKYRWYANLKHRKPTGTPILRIIMSPFVWRDSVLWARAAMAEVTV